MAHTKGKWSYAPGDYNSIDQDTETHPGSIICDDESFTWYIATIEYLRDEAKANAQLMAAAPDLLEAAQAALVFCETAAASQIDSEYERLVVEPLRAAIRKAKGEVSNG